MKLCHSTVGVGGVMGDTVQLFGAAIGRMKKIKIHLGLWRCPINSGTYNNQPTTGGCDRGDDRKEVEREARGKHNTIAFRRSEVKGRETILNYIIDLNDCQWNVKMQQPPKNGQARRSRGWGRGTITTKQEQDAQDACTVSASNGGRWLHGTSLTIARYWVMMLSTMTPIQQ